METENEFWAPGFGLAYPRRLSFREWTNRWRIFFLSPLKTFSVMWSSHMDILGGGGGGEGFHVTQCSSEFPEPQKVSRAHPLTGVPFCASTRFTWLMLLTGLQVTWGVPCLGEGSTVVIPIHAQASFVHLRVFLHRHKDEGSMCCSLTNPFQAH